MKLNHNVLYYNAGQIATIVLNLTDDTYKNVSVKGPRISCIYDPSLKLLPNSYPLAMHEFLPSIYIAKIQLPGSIRANGTYLCVVEWLGDDNVICRVVYSIIVGIPIGNPTASGA